MMQPSRNTTAAGLGARVLGEIEETTLDEVLASLRAALTATTTTTTTTTTTRDTTTTIPLTISQPKTFPLPALNALVHRHFRATHSAPLALTGRPRELLYPLIATLISPPHNQAVSVVDFDSRFDPVRLLSTAPFEGASSPPGYALRRADLQHVHVLRPPARGPPGHVAAQVARMEAYMLYGAHASRGREWWGTVVIGGGTDFTGGSAGHVAVTADWKGWMRVERRRVEGFGEVGVEEAMEAREGREREVEEAGWVGVSPWGVVRFGGVGG